MHREVAKAVDFVGFAFVDGVFPVDFKKMIQDSCCLVYIIIVESDHANTHDVGDIMNVLVFVSLKLEFSSERALCFHTVLHVGHNETCFGKEVPKLSGNHLGHFLVNRKQLSVLCQQDLCVGRVGDVFIAHR